MPTSLTPEQKAGFTSALRDEFRAAWQLLRTARPDDTVYGFGLYTGDDAASLAVVAFSEQGLQQVSARYADEYSSGAALHRRSLRWGPADSPLLDKNGEVLPRSQALRNALPDLQAEAAGGLLSAREASAVARAAFAATFAALKSLDAEGVFGRGLEREALLLGVWPYDESEARKVAAARKLNPPSAVARYEAELADGMKAYDAWLKQYIAAMMKAKAEGKDIGRSARRQAAGR